MRSAKVGLVTRIVATAAAALRTVPAGRNRCAFLACSCSVRAYPTALACKVSMRQCSALRRPTCFGLLCTCRFHECGGIGQCVLLHSVCTSACTVEGRIATRTASVHKRAARISIARRAGHACSSSSTRWWDHYLRGVTGDGSWCTSGGICVRDAALRLQLGVRRSSRCACLHADAMEHSGRRLRRAMDSTSAGIADGRDVLLSLARGNHLNPMPQEDAQALMGADPHSAAALCTARGTTASKRNLYRVCRRRTRGRASTPRRCRRRAGVRHDPRQ
jgi:hypothetical protein